MEHNKEGKCKQHPASPVFESAKCIILLMIYSVMYFNVNSCPQLGHCENNSVYFSEALLIMHSPYWPCRHCLLVITRPYATFTTCNNLLSGILNDLWQVQLDLHLVAVPSHTPASGMHDTFQVTFKPFMCLVDLLRRGRRNSIRKQRNTTPRLRDTSACHPKRRKHICRR